MNTPLVVRSISALVLVALLWVAWWVFGRSPEAQVRAAQAALIEAVEDRDWDDLAELLAENYTDAYGHTRESAIQDGRKFLSGFYTLTLKTEQTIIQAVKGQGVVKMQIRLEGNGAGYSQMVLGHVNQLTGPWTFHWSNPGRWPWDWQVTMVLHDQVN